MNKRFEKWGTTEIIQDKRYAWSLEKICDYLNENFDKITDLEAKLAESEHRNTQLVEALNGEVFINYKVPMENAQLKQQLAEKEIRMKESEIFYKREINRRDTKLANQKVELKHHNQDKIELLEKVKTIITSKTSNGIYLNKKVLDKKIDTLISEIKGE